MKYKLYVFLYILAVMVLIAGWPASWFDYLRPKPQAGEGRIGWVECEGPAAAGLAELPGTIRCGFITAPENRAKPGGKTLQIHVVQAKALGEPREAKALFLLAGGPGEAATASASGTTRELERLRRSHDLVFVDVRGTGRSNPLACPLLGPEYSLQTYLRDLFDIARIRACHARLAPANDLDQYRTTEIAADIEAVRKALGYKRIDLLGGSYGTRLAQAYARAYPAAVRTITLAGPVKLDERMPMHFARDAENALEALIADCEADAACSAAWPDFRAELRALIASLRQGPLRAEVEHPGTGVVEVVEVAPGAAISQLRNMLYWSNEAAGMPAQVAALTEGDYAPFVLGIADYMHWIYGGGGGLPAIYDGLYLSVTCAEDVPFIDWAAAEAESQGTLLGTYRLDQQRAACEVWRVAPVDASFHQPLVSSAPALIMVGEHDPVTPPRNAYDIARTLPNSLVLMFENQGHATEAPCKAGAIIDFVRTGSLTAVDRTCGQGLTRPPFVVPESQ